VEVIAEDIPGWTVASKGSLTVALDITITEALKMEGDAREFVNRVQTIRKESGFELTDRITVAVSTNKTLQESINQFNRYICAEILADSIEFVPALEEGTEVEVNENMVKLQVSKKS
jgi:isoleucyl-tRNA synthetase